MTTTLTAGSKVRLRFAKHGDLRLVSHHDLMRCLERLLRRAEIPVAQTQGFNPHPRVVFALALALGIEGRREVVEIDLAEPMEPSEVLARLQAASPPGLDWLSAETAAKRAAQATVVHYRLDSIPSDRRDAAFQSLSEFLQSERWPIMRHRPDRPAASEIDLRPFVLEAELDATGGLTFRMKILPTGSARAE